MHLYFENFKIFAWWDGGDDSKSPRRLQWIPELAGLLDPGVSLSYAHTPPQKHERCNTSNERLPTTAYNKAKPLTHSMPLQMVMECFQRKISSK